jgi:predicted outer membrane repeat protein
MGANTALRLHDCWNKIIGDENASPAANIVIKDTDGLTNLTGNGISIYATDCANLTFDNLAVSQKTPATIGTGIQLDNCLGDMDFKNLTVTKLNEGIIFNSPSANLELTCSAIYRNSIGVRVYSSGGATILNNNFKENTYRSVVNSSSFPPVDAQSNYWLNADGSTTPADAVNGYTGDVNVDPALSAPAGCASAFPAPARFYVDVDATAGANNGTWWTDAFTDLQSAVGLAYAGDEIWVAEGTYYPTADGNQGVYFNVRGGVKIYGGFDGTEDELTDRVLAGNETILSGDIGNAGDVADNSDILMAISNATAETRVDGFTFSGANNGYTSGALSIANGTVINCIFRNNTAYAGGGMSIGGGTVNLENCLFHDNYGGAGGGAISSGDGTLVATNCIFRNNRGGDSGGAFFSQASPNATFTNCLFYGQSVISYDGAVMFSGGTVSLDHCTVVGQHEPPGAGFARHRAMSKTASLWNNPSGDLGGGTLDVSYSITQNYFPGTATRTATRFLWMPPTRMVPTIFLALPTTAWCPANVPRRLTAQTRTKLRPWIWLANPRVDAPVFGVSPADIGAYEQQNVNFPVVITNIEVPTTTVFDDNGTICTADDSFTADVTVSFTNLSSTGNLSLTSDHILTPVTPVPIGSTTTPTTHVFTGVSLRADSEPLILTAQFSDAPCRSPKTQALHRAQDWAISSASLAAHNGSTMAVPAAITRMSMTSTPKPFAHKPPTTKPNSNLCRLT